VQYKDVMPALPARVSNIEMAYIFEQLVRMFNEAVTTLARRKWVFLIVLPHRDSLRPTACHASALRVFGLSCAYPLDDKPWGLR
jgi:hypothetical protein